MLTQGLPDRCSHGHPYTKENTLTTNSRRSCRQCDRNRHHHNRVGERDLLTNCPHTTCTWTYVGPSSRATVRLTDHRNLMHNGT